MNQLAAAESTEQTAYRDRCLAWYDQFATRRTGEDDLWPIPAYVDDEFAQQSFDDGRRWQGLLAEHGWAGIAWPAEYGGGGGKSWMTRIFSEVSADYEEWPGFIGATIAMLGPTLLRHGTEDQKRHYIPKLLSGEMTFCQLFSEPGAGSDLAGLAMRAELDGDEFVVSGQKVWNSQAQFCDWGFVLVRTDPDAPKHKGITFLLVDMATPGIEPRPLMQINGSSHFNEVFFTDVRIPVENVVGEINGGWGPTRTVMTNESAFIGNRKSSTPLVSLTELARRHGLLTDPLVRQRLADLHTRERIQSWMGETIQKAIRRGEMPPMDPGLMKLFATETKRRVGDIAMTVAGAGVIATDAPPARWAQYELMGRYALSIGGGTDEVMRNNIGERALGLPREPRADKDMPWREVPR